MSHKNESHKAMIKERKERLKSLMEEHAELQTKLFRSLEIQMLWNEAFKLGACTSYLTGNMMRPESLQLVIERKDGKTKSFPIKEISRDLLEFNLSKLRPGLNQQDRTKILLFWEKLHDNYKS